jgi:hypothetical protein
VDGDETAIDELGALVRRADAVTMRLLAQIVQQAVGLADTELALGLLEQLRQAAEIEN